MCSVPAASRLSRVAFALLLKLGDELGDELRIFALSEQFNPGN